MGMMQVENPARKPKPTRYFIGGKTVTGTRSGPKRAKRGGTVAKKPAKRSGRKKGRSAAQKAATAKMLAANRAKRSGSSKGPSKRAPSKRAAKSGSGRKRTAWNKGKRFTHKKRVSAYEREPVVSAHERHVNPRGAGGGAMATKRKRRRRKTSKRKNPSVATRSNPRRRSSRRRYSRRSNPGTMVAIAETVGGGVCGAALGYATDHLVPSSVSAPWRAGGLVVGGVVLGALVGNWRPALGTALGAGIAGAGVARGVSHFAPSPGSAPAPKQLVAKKAAPKQLVAAKKKAIKGLGMGEAYDYTSGIEGEYDGDVEGVEGVEGVDGYADDVTSGIEGASVDLRSLSY